MPVDDATKLLIDPATLQALPAQFENVAATDDTAAAGDFVRLYEDFLKTHPNFAKEFPDAAAIYQRYLLQVKWVGLRHLPERDLRALFSQNFSAIFAIPEYDLTEHVNERLRFEPIDGRDELRKLMSDALAEGTGEITRTKITTNAGEQPGTVGNWIKDYISEVGPQRETVKRAQYLSGGANMKKLAPEERERVKRLIELYEYLQLSSVSAEGFEEDVYPDTEGRGTTYISGGEEIEVGEEIIKRAREIIAARSKVSDEQLLAIYKGTDEEQSAIAAAAGEIQKKSKDPKAWEKMLVDAVAPTSPTGKPAKAPRVVALVRLLIASGQFEKALRSNASLQQIVIEWYKKQNRGAEIDAFKLQPTNAPHIASFLRAVFEDRLKLPLAESARFGMQLANALRKQGRPELLEFVHFDQAARGFRWL